MIFFIGDPGNQIMVSWYWKMLLIFGLEKQVKSRTLSYSN